MISSDFAHSVWFRVTLIDVQQKFLAVRNRSRPTAIIDGLADSKLLAPKRREELFAVISNTAIAIGIGQAEVEEVDRMNAYWAAAMEARRRAVEALATIPALVFGAALRG